MSAASASGAGGLIRQLAASSSLRVRRGAALFGSAGRLWTPPSPLLAGARCEACQSQSAARAFSTTGAIQPGDKKPLTPAQPQGQTPFEPPPVPEGVDTSIAEENERRQQLEEEGGEPGSSSRTGSGRGRSVSKLSDDELARRRQARNASAPRTGDGSSGGGGGGSRRGAPGEAERPPWYKSPTTLVLGFIPIFTFGLGYWQIERLKWKVSLIEELEDKLRKDPIRLPKHVNLDALPEFEFRLVEVTGRFDYSRAMLLGPRVREGQMGYQVVVPFLRTFPDGTTGDAILVNRGYITDANVEAINTAARSGTRDGATQALQRALGPPDGRRIKHDSPAAQSLGSAMTTAREEAIVALLPRVYPRNSFTPPNKPEKNEWFHVEPKQMAQWAAQRGEPVLPIYLEEIFDGHAGEIARRLTTGTPIGRAATIELRNQHAVYAATWFSLSAATGVMFALLVKRGR